MITEQDLREATGDAFEIPFSVDAIDMAGADTGTRILAFLDDEKFLPDALANPSLAVLLVTPELEPAARALPATVIVVDDPRWTYYSLHNLLASRAADATPSSIHPDAVIHPSAHIDDQGVVIAAGVVVEANATIHSSSIIGPGTVIRAGAVIGTSGFEHKRTSRGVLSVVHDGETRIGSRVEIGALAVIGKGFARRHTVVGDDSRIDCHVMIAHGSQLGERVFVAAGAVLAGSTSIGDDTWIGPHATLIDRVVVGAGSRIGIGSVVFKEVPAGSRVLGNPARQTGTA